MSGKDSYQIQDSYQNQDSYQREDTYQSWDSYQYQDNYRSEESSKKSGWPSNFEDSPTDPKAYESEDVWGKTFISEEVQEQQQKSEIKSEQGELFPNQQFDDFFFTPENAAINPNLMPSRDYDFIDPTDQVAIDARIIKMDKKLIFSAGIGGMAFFALIFVLAIVAKKKRKAAEKARDAIIVETAILPFFGDGKQVYDEKGNLSVAIPVGDEKESFGEKHQQQQPPSYESSPQYFGSAPTKQDKS